MEGRPSSAPKRKRAKPRKITPTVMELVSTGALENLRESVAVEEIMAVTEIPEPVDKNIPKANIIVVDCESSNMSDEDENLTIDMETPVMLLAQPPELLSDHPDNNILTILSIPATSHEDNERKEVTKATTTETVSSPPKRKRGRPRKANSSPNKSQNLESLVTRSKEQDEAKLAGSVAVGVAIKRGRGRPRKRPLENKAEVPTSIDRDQKEEIANIEINTPLETGPSPKRRRGRPRKHPNEQPVTIPESNEKQTQESSSTLQTAEDKKPLSQESSNTTQEGRDPPLFNDTNKDSSKEQDDIEASEVKQDSIKPVKRKRGRPRKNPLPASEPAKSPPKRDEPSVGKRHPGRPRKIKTVEEAAPSGKEDCGSPSRKPQLKSPTKQVLPETENSVPRKRGRPKKNKTATDEIPVVTLNLEPPKSLDGPTPSYMSVNSQPSNSFQLVLSSSSSESEDSMSAGPALNTTERQSSPLLDDRFVASSDEED